MRNMVARGKLKGSKDTGVRVGKVVNKYKVAKHFELTITGRKLRLRATSPTNRCRGGARWHLCHPYRRRQADDEQRRCRAQLQGAELCRTGVSLAQAVDLKVRPIHHRLENRVRVAHFPMHARLLCRVARARGLAQLMFADEDQAKATRDPVAPARRSAAAEKKVSSKQLEDGTPTHSFRTLIEALSTIVRNTCRVPKTDHTFPMLTIPNDLQLRARELIDKITV